MTCAHAPHTCGVFGKQTTCCLHTNTSLPGVPGMRAAPSGAVQYSRQPAGERPLTESGLESGWCPINLKPVRPSAPKHHHLQVNETLTSKRNPMASIMSMTPGRARICQGEEEIECDTDRQQRVCSEKPEGRVAPKALVARSSAHARSSKLRSLHGRPLHMQHTCTICMRDECHCSYGRVGALLARCPCCSPVPNPGVCGSVHYVGVLECSERVVDKLASRPRRHPSRSPSVGQVGLLVPSRLAADPLN